VKSVNAMTLNRRCPFAQQTISFEVVQVLADLGFVEVEIDRGVGGTWMLSEVGQASVESMKKQMDVSQTENSETTHKPQDHPLRNLTLKADYDCFPLWDNERIANVDPAELDLSAHLVSALDLWRSQYDATLNRNDPVSSGFASSEDEARFVEDGRRLARRMKNELGNGCAVSYKAVGSEREHIDAS
jgi:hypothetical protein